MNIFNLFKKQNINQEPIEPPTIKKYFIEEENYYRQDDEFNCIKKTTKYRIFRLEGQFKETSTYDEIIKSGYRNWVMFCNYDGNRFYSDKNDNDVKVYHSLEDALVAKEYIELKNKQHQCYEIKNIMVNKEITSDRTIMIKYNNIWK